MRKNHSYFKFFLYWLLNIDISNENIKTYAALLFATLPTAEEIINLKEPLRDEKLFNKKIKKYSAEQTYNFFRDNIDAIEEIIPKKGSFIDIFNFDKKIDISEITNIELSNSANNLAVNLKAKKWLNTSKKRALLINYLFYIAAISGFARSRYIRHNKYGEIKRKGPIPRLNRRRYRPEIEISYNMNRLKSSVIGPLKKSDNSYMNLIRNGSRHKYQQEREWLYENPILDNEGYYILDAIEAIFDFLDKDKIQFFKSILKAISIV